MRRKYRFALQFAHYCEVNDKSLRFMAELLDACDDYWDAAQHHASVMTDSSKARLKIRRGLVDALAGQLDYNAEYSSISYPAFTDQDGNQIVLPG